MRWILIPLNLSIYTDFIVSRDVYRGSCLSIESGAPFESSFGKNVEESVLVLAITISILCQPQTVSVTCISGVSELHTIATHSNLMCELFFVVKYLCCYDLFTY